MRLPLSRLTAALVIGLAFATAPGVAVHRVGGREGTARVTARGGLHRLSASEAVHGLDDTAPDQAMAGDVVSDPTSPADAGSPPGMQQATAAVLPPVVDSVRLDAPPPDAFHPADTSHRPPGRAPPVR